TADALSCKVLPEQIGVLSEATGVAGVGCTTTVAVSVAEVQLFLTAYSVYVPDCVGTAFVIDGFWADDVNPDVPAHVHATPAESLAPVSIIVDPSHIGETAEAVTTGALGSFNTTGPVMLE